MRNRSVRWWKLLVLLTFAAFLVSYFFFFNIQPNEDTAIYPRIQNIQCDRLFRGDTSYMQKIAEHRPVLVDTEEDGLIMNCEEIRKRIVPAHITTTGYSIAFAKLVFQDYVFLEEQLANTYSPENWYCFAIDKKAALWFRRRFVSLATCLPNVILSHDELNMDSAGHFQNMAHLDCLYRLHKMKWRYAVLLQNHDIIIKSNAELVDIMRILNGTNDIEITPCPVQRCIPTLERNLGKLQLCPRYLKGEEMEICQRSNITWGKGSMQAMLSREAVDFIFAELNTTLLLKELNAMGFGVDEVFFQSLQITRQLRLPGGYHEKCLPKTNTFVSRWSHWTVRPSDCKSKMLRHSICIWGIEDLPTLASSPKIMANKMLPTFDYAAIKCIGQLLQNRTKGIQDTPLDKQFYNQLQIVRYNRERQRVPFSLENFIC